MTNTITLDIDGQALTAEAGITVLAALSQTGIGCTRLSVSGQPRSALCGMGVCQECRVSVNGRRQLACQTLVAPGMHVQSIVHGC
jgi:predicted molibdopterin-dependent oxidoreductase YjgC